MGRDGRRTHSINVALEQNVLEIVRTFVLLDVDLVLKAEKKVVTIAGGQRENRASLGFSVTVARGNGRYGNIISIPRRIKNKTAVFAYQSNLQERREMRIEE